jgi:cold shock CspA family protein
MERVALTGSSSSRVDGIVDSFDAHVGFGYVRADPPSAFGSEVRSWFFHCTQIAGGARTIAVGTPVSFAIVPGRLGRWEATVVTAREEPHE